MADTLPTNAGFFTPPDFSGQGTDPQALQDAYQRNLIIQALAGAGGAFTQAGLPTRIPLNNSNVAGLGLAGLQQGINSANAGFFQQQLFNQQMASGNADLATKQIAAAKAMRGYSMGNSLLGIPGGGGMPQRGGPAMAGAPQAGGGGAPGPQFASAAGNGVSPFPTGGGSGQPSAPSSVSPAGGDLIGNIASSNDPQSLYGIATKAYAVDDPAFKNIGDLAKSKADKLFTSQVDNYVTFDKDGNPALNPAGAAILKAKKAFDTAGANQQNVTLDASGNVTSVMPAPGANSARFSAASSTAQGTASGTAAGEPPKPTVFINPQNPQQTTTVYLNRGQMAPAGWVPSEAAPQVAPIAGATALATKAGQEGLTPSPSGFVPAPGVATSQMVNADNKTTFDNAGTKIADLNTHMNNLTQREAIINSGMLTPGVVSGRLNEAKALASQLGLLTPQAAASADAGTVYNALATGAAFGQKSLENISKLTNFDMGLFIKQVPQLENNPNALRTLTALDRLGTQYELAHQNFLRQGLMVGKPATDVENAWLKSPEGKSPLTANDNVGIKNILNPTKAQVPTFSSTADLAQWVQQYGSALQGNHKLLDILQAQKNRLSFNESAGVRGAQ